MRENSKSRRQGKKKKKNGPAKSGNFPTHETEDFTETDSFMCKEILRSFKVR